MKLSYTLGVTACAALLAASGIASAVTTTYQTSGYIVQASDAAGGALCKAFGTTVGAPSTSTVFWAGQGATGTVLVSPGTAKQSSNTSNKTATSICTTSNTADLTGASTMNFNCYENTQGQTSIPSSAIATIAATFKGAATSVNAGTATAGAAINVETTSTLSVTGVGSCSFTTDATWTSE